MNEYKTCTRCKANLPFSSFSIHRGAKANKDGFRSQCKDCQRLANQIYRLNNRDKVNAAKRKHYAEKPDLKAAADKRYREANREVLLQKKREYSKNNREKNRLYRASQTPEQKNRKKLLDIAYGKANREQNRLATRRYRMNNPDKARESARTYIQRNPEIAANRSATRRARKYANGIYRVTAKEIKQLRSQICFYCKIRPGTTIDHVMPIARGGGHSIGNLVSACRSCNSSKSHKTKTEWEKWKRANE